MSDLSTTAVLPHARSFRSLFEYVPYQRIGAFTAGIDVLLILAASAAAGSLYHHVMNNPNYDFSADVAEGACAGLIFTLLTKLLRLYRPNALLSRRTQFRGVTTAWAAVLMCVTSIFFLLESGSHYSRLTFVGFGIIGFVFLLTSRAIIGLNLRQALADGTLAGRRVIVIGDPDEIAALSSLDLLRNYGTREVGRFELSPPTHLGSATTINDAAILNTAIKIAQAKRAEQVLLALRWADSARRNLICEHLRTLPLPVMLLPDQSVQSVWADTDSAAYPLTTIEIQRAPLSRRDLVLKRMFDLVFGSLGLIMLSPLLLVTSVAIKFDSKGPVIFRQRRRGFNGREFAIYKFRTMTVLEDGPSVRQAQRHDDRVTRVGRMLRTSSIDELPQLINVLRGNMSLVGPRPHAVAHDDQYSSAINNYAFRHHVKPGITGWAQIHGLRGETVDIALMKKRIQLDLWYINNWTLWLDFRIMLRTSAQLLRPSNVY